MPETVQVGTPSERERFKQVARIIKAEADGKFLRAELRVEIKAVLDPAVQEVKQGFLAWGSGGMPHVGEPLAPAVARNVKVGISTGGRLTGARVYVSKKGLPRRFVNAPRDINAPSWNHPGGHGGPDVTQVGAPGVFDNTLRGKQSEFRTAVNAAVESMAERIAARSREV